MRLSNVANELTGLAASAFNNTTSANDEKLTGETTDSFTRILNYSLIAAILFVIGFILMFLFWMLPERGTVVQPNKKQDHNQKVHKITNGSHNQPSTVEQQRVSCSQSTQIYPDEFKYKTRDTVFKPDPALVDGPFVTAHDPSYSNFKTLTLSRSKSHSKKKSPPSDQSSSSKTTIKSPRSP